MTMYPITAVCRLWQSQFEQSLRIWAWWAQLIPQESAAELSADAEAEGRAASANATRRRKRPAAEAA